MTTPTIRYTHTDEAPALATYSFLPILEAFAGAVGVKVESPNISLAARVLAAFNDRLAPDQRVEDALSALGDLAKRPEANIIKLPNISASVPQLKAVIAELQGNGFPLPDYPDEPEDVAQAEIKTRYDKVKGSAVNPVLREGNSDRRAPAAVKQYARKNPHRMGKWASDTRSHVATMSTGDFFHNEKSVTLDSATTARIEHVATDGTVTVLREGIKLLEGEILDGTFMSRSALVDFLSAQVADARAQNLLFSLHMKATMMKVSDPIIFGHAVRVYFKDVFDKYAAILDGLGVDVNNGLGDLLAKIQELPESERKAIEADIAAVDHASAGLAMVDSDRGITNLHVPSDIIIDASMPAMIRTSGSMWDRNGELHETKAVIPDSSYAGIYSAVFADCKANGAYDPTTMGSVSNVGLMAQKAEEYGSHDKTFEIESDGRVRVVDAGGNELLGHDVAAGDIWRACQVKDLPIQDWVKLAVRRARATGTPAVFWLDAERAHDAAVIAKIERYLPTHDVDGLQFEILAPADACTFTLARVRKGLDTISVSGNVLRDYLTDLFPILELGTSAKMLSIVPLMNGGGLFETGAGGSAPKHVQQFEAENHLRWDSLGEFLALAVSFQHLGETEGSAACGLLGRTLDDATTQYLLNDKSPSRKVGELDNRGSHYFLARYWAGALASQSENPELAATFAPLAKALEGAEDEVLAELNGAQGKPMDIGGYYFPTPALASAAMRPSAALNAIVDGFRN